MRNIKICLDAGHHGKYNRSPAIKTYYESEMNWKLHLLLKTELEKYGIEVKTTRTEQEVDMGLTARGKASSGYDLFLSIHSNAVGGGVNESIDYPIVYVPINGKGSRIGELLANCIAGTMGTNQAGRISSRKGINGDYYGVIRGATAVGTIGLILEHSFHTNTNATKWLLDDNNLAKMAKAEAAVIADYFGIQKSENTDIKDDKKVVLTVDGKWGKATTTRLQQIFGTTVDGVISNQWATYKSKNPGLMGGWKWKHKPNGKGSQLIKAMQKWAGMTSADCDGEIGPNTIKAFQDKLGTPIDGYISSPSAMVKALQRWANEQ